MKQFLGVVRYEYGMSIRRKGVLIVGVLFALAYIGLNYQADSPMIYPDSDQLWKEEAAWFAFSQGIFFPVAAGIMASDRAARDWKLNVRQLLQVSGLKNSTYVFGKYIGVVLSLFTLQTFIYILLGVVMILGIGAPFIYLPHLLLYSLLINLPGLMFITAFSLACPLIMPLRVYQILFTGYWYWGNFINPEFIPSISNTVLNASGKFVLQYLAPQNFGLVTPSVTVGFVTLNIVTLLGCAFLALLVMTRYITIIEN